MSIKRIVCAVMAALVVGGVSNASTQSARAATAACGPNCIGVFSDELGTYPSPGFVEHVFGGTAAVGTRTGLTTVSNTDPSEDFINPHPGTVSDYFKLGLVSAAVNRHYGSLTASQLDYAPLGVPTGLCVAAGRTLFQGEALRLRRCSVPGKTVWIIATSLSPSTAAAHFFPIVSGATRDFAHPFTMTYPRHVDTSEPLPPIRLRRMLFCGPDHLVPVRQLWGVRLGEL